MINSALVSGQGNSTSTMAKWIQAPADASMDAFRAGDYDSISRAANVAYAYILNHATVAMALAESLTIDDAFNLAMHDVGNAKLMLTIAASAYPPGIRSNAVVLEASGAVDGTPCSRMAGFVLTKNGGHAQAVTTIGAAGAFGIVQLAGHEDCTYTINCDHPAVVALRSSVDALIDTFTFVARDKVGTMWTSLLAITITTPTNSKRPFKVMGPAKLLEQPDLANDEPFRTADGNLANGVDNPNVVKRDGRLAGTYGMLTPAAVGGSAC